MSKLFIYESNSQNEALHQNSIFVQSNTHTHIQTKIRECVMCIQLQRREEELLENWIEQESELIELCIGCSNNPENSESLITYGPPFSKSQSSIISDFGVGLQNFARLACQLVSACRQRGQTMTEVLSRVQGQICKINL